MKITKKALSIVLALVMLVNIFAVMASAAAPDSAIDLYITPDKEYYEPGDEVVFTISEQAIAAVGNMRVGGQYPIAYNSAVLVPYSTSTALADHGVVALQGGYDESISVIADNSWTTVDEKYDWNAVIIPSLADDWATEFDATTAKADLFTFKMKIAADAKDGEYVVGFNQASYEDYTAYSNDAIMGGVYGFYDDYGYGTTANYGLGTCIIKVGAPAATEYTVNWVSDGNIVDTTTTTDYATATTSVVPTKFGYEFAGWSEAVVEGTTVTYTAKWNAIPLTVSYWKDQIKFNVYGGSGAAADDYKGTFDYRILATIDNFDDVYASIDDASASIKDVGFIFNKGAALVEADAKAQVEGGTAKYSQVKDVYVSTAYGGEEYVISCIVRNVKDADKTTSLSAMAYVVYEQNGETKYAYSAVQTSTFEGLYNQYFSQAFPEA